MIINGALTGSGGLNKKGAGALGLPGTNLYQGVTEIEAGTVFFNNVSGLGTTDAGTTLFGGTLYLLDGSHTAPVTEPITVAGSATLRSGNAFSYNLSGPLVRGSGYAFTATQTLRGNGTLTGNATTTGTIAPGLSTGTLTSNGNLAFDTGSTFSAEIDILGTAQVETATTAGVAPGTDLLAVAGQLDVSGATLNLVVTGTPTAPAYIIATYGTRSGNNFAAVNNLPAGYQIDYSYNSGTAIAVVASSGGNNYASWASANGVTGGPSGDSDNDGTCSRSAVSPVA